VRSISVVVAIQLEQCSGDSSFRSVVAGIGFNHISVIMAARMLNV
jgi:hypothetical protein